MAGIAFRLAHDAAATARWLAERRNRARRLRPVLKSAGEHMLRSIDETFRQQGRPHRWQPLSAATRQRKRGPKILTESHRLRRSITYQAGDRELDLGTNVVYGRIHQLGGRAGRGHAVRIPARPYLVVQTEDETAILAMIGDYIAGGR